MGKKIETPNNLSSYVIGMEMNLRQKWSIAILALMVLTVPTYYLFRWHKATLDVGEVSIDNNNIGWTNAGLIRAVDPDIVYLEITANTTLVYEIREFDSRPTDGLEGDQFLNGTLLPDEMLILQFNAQGQFNYNIVVYLENGMTGAEVATRYYKQTATNGFYITLIFLAVVLAIVWVGSLLMPKIPPVEQ